MMTLAGRTAHYPCSERVQDHRLVLWCRTAGPGTSAGSSSPCLRQPTASSHVRARATGRASTAGSTSPSTALAGRQPSNHRADDAGSNRAAPERGRACRRAFRST